MSKHSKKSRKMKTQTVEQKTIPPSNPVWKKYPALFSFGLILILLLIFFREVLFENKTFLPPDAITSQCFKTFIQGALHQGIYPLWNPYIFCGMPSFASLSSVPNSIHHGLIFNFISAILDMLKNGLSTHFIRILINYFLLGGFVFLYLRNKKLSPSVCFYSSIAFVFMPQIIAYAAFGHTTKLETAVFIPILFLLIEKLLEKRNLLFFSLTGLCVGLQLLLAHIQIAFYTHLMIGIFLIYWVIQTYREEKNLKLIFQGIGLWAGAIVLGALVSSVLNLSIWEYAHYSIRGGASSGLDYGYATSWSFPPSEMTTFFIPSFMGFGGSTYWGPMPFTDFPLYFGIVTFLLAGLAILLNRNRTTWFFIILAVISLLMSFGKHFPVLYGPMFKLLPFFSKFRVPNMVLILFNFAMVVLAGFGLQALLNFKKSNADKSKLIHRYIFGFGTVTALLLFILFIGKGSYLNWAQRIGSNEFAAYDKATGDGLRAMLFLFLSGGAILLAVRGNLKTKHLPLILGVLLIIDLWTVDNRFIEPRNKVEKSAYFSETPEVQFLIEKLKEKNEPFRILPVGDQRTVNWYMYHGIQNVNGYHAAKIKIYQKLLESFDMPNGFLKKYIKPVQGKYTWKTPSEISEKQMRIDQTFLKMTNVKYIVSPYILPDTTLEPVVPPSSRGANGIMQYKHALPRVLFPQKTIQIEGEENILNYMTSGQFDPSMTAILEEKPPFQIEASNDNRATITDYDLHYIKIEAEIKTPSQMVLSEIYYPAGWKAYVNGQETKIFKTDYVLRSIFMYPGTYIIEFKFNPKAFHIGRIVYWASLFFLFCGIIAGFLLERKKLIKTKETS